MSATKLACLPATAAWGTYFPSPLTVPAQRGRTEIETPDNHGRGGRTSVANTSDTREVAIAAAVARARSAGIDAVWTGPCTACVELARLAGPEHHVFNRAEAAQFGLPGPAPWQFLDLAVRVTVYERVLTSGTSFDIYRWVNLIDLAAVWPTLRLPVGVHSEWLRALQAATLRPPPR